MRQGGSWSDWKWIVASVGIAVWAATALAAGPEKVSLVGKDLSPWRGDTAAWMIVGDVAVDANDAKRLSSTPGTGVLLNGKAGSTLNAVSKYEHGDVEIHVEFMVPQGSNSGVYLQGRYEIQILDSWGVKEPTSGDCGAIYERWEDGKGFEGRAPRVNASLAPGQWQTFDAIFRAPRFDAEGKKIANARFVKVTHNGQVVHENVDVTGPTRAATFDDEKPLGPLMLQGDHGPVAYRNVWLKPIGAKD